MLAIKINALPTTLFLLFNTASTDNVSQLKFNQDKMFPLVHLDTLPDGSIPTDEVAHTVTNALRESGFLIIKAPLLTLELQRRALRAASEILQMESSSTIESHPTDPKIYAMLVSNTIDSGKN